MGREIRRVPPNWRHPRDEHTRRYIPLYDKSYFDMKILQVANQIEEVEQWGQILIGNVEIVNGAVKMVPLYGIGKAGVMPATTPGGNQNGSQKSVKLITATRQLRGSVKNAGLKNQVQNLALTGILAINALIDLKEKNVMRLAPLLEDQNR